MCGIAGILEFNNRRSGSEIYQALHQMSELLKHRGPDDHGYFLTDTTRPKNQICFRYPNQTKIHEQHNLGFAHRRLSILDLSPDAAQPMTTTDQNLWITYNGELFNYVEIREELKRGGVAFRTQSDTEVILRSYEKWGENCLQHFNGMWAFAIWDRRARKIFCARDRFGIKPFYYYFDPQCFAFASEIKSLVSDSKIPKQPHDQSIFDYLCYGLQDHTQFTFFKNINQIPPAHYLAIDTLGKIEIKQWWDIPLQRKNENLKAYNLQEVKDRFYNLLENSVAIRLRSDVPVGISLSGGLDSSSIAYLASRITANKFKTFSACYNEKSCDDRFFIETVLQDLTVDPFYTFPRAEQLWGDVDRMTWFMDEPFYSSNQFAQWCVMKLTADQNIKVILSGQGSDEYLAGYRGYNSVFISELMRALRLREAAWNFTSIRSHQEGIHILPFLLRIIFGAAPKALFPFARAFEQISGKTPKGHQTSLLNTNFFNSFHEHHLSYLKRRSMELGNLNEKLKRDTLRYSLPLLLHYEDRNGMAFSIEARHPFLDHRLVEFVFSLPSSFKINEGRNKWLLRESMRGILPEAIRDRRDKKGFVTPEANWISEGCKKVEALYQSGEIASAPYVNPKILLRNFHDLNQKKYFSGQTELWRLINLEIWFRKFF